MPNEFKAKNGVITPVLQTSTAGSAGAPSITKSDDLNTGIFFPSADVIAISTGGSERMRISAAGRVGIGSSDNNYHRLVVTESVNSSATVLLQANATGVAPGITQFATRNAGARVENNDVLGTLIFQGWDGVSNSGQATIYGSVDGTTAVNSIPTRLSFLTTPSGSIIATERMRIDSSGNVGIGTSSPGTKLEISGSSANGNIVNVRSTGATQYSLGGISLLNGATSNNSSVTIGTGVRDANGANSYFTIFKGTNASAYVASLATYDLTADYWAFQTANTERLRIDSSGNVGIGTSSPVTALTLGNTRLLSWLNASGGYSATAGATIFKWSDNNLYIDNFDGNLVFRGASYTERFRIESNGAWGLSGANYGTSGQVLTSSGSGSAPTWQSASSGAQDYIVQSFGIV